MQHTRNRAVVDYLVGFHRFGIILLDEAIDLRKLPQVIADFAIAR